MISEALFSSNDPCWQTPKDVLDVFRKVNGGDFWMDPCTAPDNPTGAFHFRAKELGQDGLTPWLSPNSMSGMVWINPPYGNELDAWSRKYEWEADQGHEMVMLVPSRTETAWFRRSWKASSCVAFWPRRIKFINAQTGAPATHAPFPSVVFYRRGLATGSKWRFLEAMEKEGCMLAKV